MANKDTVRESRILESIAQCVIVTDLEGTIIAWNPASEHVFGFTKDEMINQSIFQLYSEEETEKFEHDLGVLREGKDIQGQRQISTKFGSKIWVNIHAKPLFSDNGEPEAIIATVQDVQEFKQMENELKGNRAQAQAILETTLDGIITLDEEGRILSFNKAATKIFGYEEEEILGKDVNILIPKTSLNQNGHTYLDIDKKSKRRFVGSRVEMTGVRKDGSRFPTEFSVSEVEWNGSRIFTAVVNDISERRRLEKEILRISEEERRSLGRDLHDGLGQMLSGIRLISQNLARRLETEGVPAADEVREISNLIKKADEYTKVLARGLVHVDFEEDGLQEALYQLSRQAEELFRINCHFHYQKEVSIDNSMKAMNLYRIAQEAISNAVKHGNAENIDIRLQPENGSLVLSVTDDGIGLSETTKLKKSKGMGVHIMRYRANMMSGRLEMFETEDHKTKVVCVIPHNN